MTLDEARRYGTELFCPDSLPREPVDQVIDRHVQGSDGHQIPIRIYIPKHEGKLPVFVYYHRGGWVFCNVKEADPVCRLLANHMECIVISVDYRLAPENPFPKPFNDCYDVACWASEHAHELGGDADRLIVGGESVGGNMTASVALRARDEKGPKIALQLMMYPVISSTLNEPAYAKSADQYFITKESMRFFWNAYAPTKAQAAHPYASPDLAEDLTSLPPAVVVTAEHDPLCDEGESYAMRLKEAGNSVKMDRIPGVVHGFLDLPMYEEQQKLKWIAQIKEDVDAFLLARRL